MSCGPFIPDLSAALVPAHEENETRTLTVGLPRAALIRHILNVTEDLSNFFGEMPHLSYLRVPLHDRPEAGLELESHFPECVRFIDR